MIFRALCLDRLSSKNKEPGTNYETQALRIVLIHRAFKRNEINAAKVNRGFFDA